MEDPAATDAGNENGIQRDNGQQGKQQGHVEVTVAESSKKPRTKKKAADMFIAFLNGLPRFRAARGMKRLLTPLLKKYRFMKFVLDHNSDGHSRGYGWLYFNSAEDRGLCCREMSEFRVDVPVYKSNRSGTEPHAEENVGDDVERELVHEIITLRLTIQPAFNNKACMAWPYVSVDQRQQLRLDPEAYFSITDGYTAIDTADIIGVFLNALSKEISSSSTSSSSSSASIATASSGVCIDCTAGGGGNTAAFIRSGLFHKVIGCEVNSSRYEDLKSNIEIICGAGNWKTTNSNILSSLFYSSKDTENNFIQSEALESIDLLYFDPPWGGQTYKQDMGLGSGAPTLPNDYFLDCAEDLAVPSVTDNDIFASYGVKQLQAGMVSVAMSRLLGYECVLGSLANRVRLAAMKVPSDFDAAAFFRRIVGQSGIWKQELSRHGTLTDCRPHPFRLQLGAKTALLVIAYPPFYDNRSLNDIMSGLASFDSSHGLEFHPRFFDWEKEIWISCRRWHGF
jgi:16S rRNA G966 N2-methylase RsmD